MSTRPNWLRVGSWPSRPRRDQVLLDENLSKGLARWLQRAGHDVVRAVDEGLSGASDDEVALWARAHDRVVVSLDEDFLNEVRFPPETQPGLIVFRLEGLNSVQRTITAMKAALAAVGDEPLSGALVIVGPTEVHIHRPFPG